MLRKTIESPCITAILLQYTQLIAQEGTFARDQKQWPADQRTDQFSLGQRHFRNDHDHFWFAGALQGRKYTWRKFMTYRTNSTDDRGSPQFSAQASTVSHVPLSATQSLPSSEATPRHQHSSSAGSSDTEYTNLDMQDLWLPDYEPTPSTLSALHQFGKEMLRLSSGLQNVTFPETDFMTDGLT